MCNQMSGLSFPAIQLNYRASPQHWVANFSPLQFAAAGVTAMHCHIELLHFIQCSLPRVTEEVSGVSEALRQLALKCCLEQEEDALKLTAAGAIWSSSWGGRGHCSTFELLYFICSSFTYLPLKKKALEVSEAVWQLAQKCCLGPQEGALKWCWKLWSRLLL